jgi:hypothetical protein
VITATYSSADERTFDPMHEPGVSCMVILRMQGERTQLRQTDLPATMAVSLVGTRVMMGRAV